MTIRDSIEVQTLLMWLLGMELNPTRLVTDDEAKLAAAKLALRSFASLHSGVDPDELQRRWPSPEVGFGPHGPPFFPAGASADVPNVPVTPFEGAYSPSPN